jgi:hypothetical protein
VADFEEPLCDAAAVVDGVIAALFDSRGALVSADVLAESAVERLGDAGFERSVEGFSVNADTAARRY